MVGKEYRTEKAPRFEREATQVTRSVVVDFLGTVRGLQKELGRRKRVRRSEYSPLRAVTDGKTISVEVELLKDLYARAFGSNERPDRKKIVDSKIVHASRHALMLVGAISSITLAGMSGEGPNTRGAIKESRGTDGSLIFTHTDKETTQIIDYITGRAPMPHAERLRLLKAYLKQGYVVEGLKAPADIDALDEAGLKEAVFHYYRVVGKESEEEAREDAEGFIEEGVPEFQSNPKLYRRLWKLQREVGAPRIRWAFDGGEDPRAIGAERANYDGLTNTAYIYPLTAFHDLIAEDAHAYQHEYTPWKTSLRYVYDGASTLVRSFTKKIDLRTAYQVNYVTAGSVEYVAHEEIEPRLRESLGGEFPTREPWGKDD